MCNCNCSAMHVYRAVVVAASSTTGEVFVKIPAALGGVERISITMIGREPQESGSWNVPEVGSQVLVAVENDRFSNVYIINTLV